MKKAQWLSVPARRHHGEMPSLSSAATRGEMVPAQLPAAPRRRVGDLTISPFGLVGRGFPPVGMRRFELLALCRTLS